MTRVVSIVHDADASPFTEHQLALRDFVRSVDMVLSIWRSGDPEDLGVALDRLDAAAKAVQR